MLQTLELGAFGTFSSDENSIPTGPYGSLTDNLSQSALHFVSGYGIPQTFTHHETEAAVIEPVGQYANN
jgi:hypothetical protein